MCIRDRVSSCNVIISEYEGRILSQKDDYSDLQKSKKTEISNLQSQIKKLNEQLEKSNIETLELKKENKKIKTENASLINFQQEKPHNERGAGRKSRITSEIRQLILDLKSQNFTQAEIAKKLTDSTGEHWSRSTIRCV